MTCLRINKHSKLFISYTSGHPIHQFVPEVKEWLVENIGPGGVYVLPSELDWNDPTIQWRMKKLMFRVNDHRGSPNHDLTYAILEFKMDFQAIIFKLKWGEGVRH